ncbi:MAG: 16S rRNA (uracil(1498)-N(3))-methyltransferase [Dorea sp.]|jgi:16S rRNA (uracil1498-N3)-methyltransferase|nr:16S rRNA (uracil(1498)-N(3))-methyltransferase [Dorea sp.]
MQHFFVPPSQVEETEIMITGSDVNHMKNVLRMRPGEEVSVSDGNNCHYLCRIKEYEGTAEAVLDIVQRQENDTELSSKIYLFQGLPKQDKMELIVQKAVELGVYQIIPVATKRCVVRLDEKKAEKKIKRWQEISKSAAKQSGRGLVPEIKNVLSWQEALREGKALDVLLIPYELEEGMAKTKEILAAICPGQSVGIFIGPEGGFEKEEVLEALEAGAEAITLGRRILRTETAGITTLSVLMFQLEE